MSNRIVSALAYRSREVLDQLWPQHCFVCGERAGLELVCTECTPLLKRLPSGLCPCCALPTPVAGLHCGRCQRKPPWFDSSLAVFVYAHPLREMVLALKHGQGFGLIDWMGASLAEIASSLKPDCVLPMPLHPARMALRGFNQSNELARCVARKLGVRMRAETVLREMDTPHLAGLRGRERLRAVRGAFRCVESLSGQHVLVVDDVMTSGATLNELARTLKQSGAARVTNLVLARTLKEKQA